MAKKNPFTWVVEIEVNPHWVADGFNLLSDEEGRCEKLEEAILAKLLPFALSSEVQVTIRRSPSPSKIAEVQGFKDVNEYYQHTTE